MNKSDFHEDTFLLAHGIPLESGNYQSRRALSIIEEEIKRMGIDFQNGEGEEFREGEVENL